MSRYYSYLNTAKQIIASYDGALPLATWLKPFFASRKQMGSRDRREVASMVYQYYRLGNSLPNAIVEDRICSAILLCNNLPHALLALLKPDWNEQITLPIDKKLPLIYNTNIKQLFPFLGETDKEVNNNDFILSHLIQPDLFIRVRPSYKVQVEKKLQAAGIEFLAYEPDCLALNNATSIANLLEVDKEIVIQDYSSQQIARFLQPLANSKRMLKVWDCCAASGGKSITALDTFGNIDLTVSDIRLSIIQNLKKRFEQAGMKKYRSFVADASKPVAQLKGQLFDLVICDAPCTGSGTWGRTPENLVFFKKENIGKYAGLQQQIIAQTVRNVADGGYFLYITCSVYKEENEGAVAFMQRQFPGLQLVQQELIIGYTKKADTMFAALFRKVDVLLTT
ncbi:Fmu (Sun) domain-containing protein [Parasediminibacterium sp. JCM 36343]|uniref:Fmu (Sun) domain-containing protein n=1 Tax=Parasediminibacterium sp. JCM 36343 TaxID=3374279 RepID=UPI00397C5D2D